MSTLQPRPSINHLLRFSTMYQHQICIGTNEPEPGARQRPRRQVLALSRGWGRAEPRRSHPAADAAGLPHSGRHAWSESGGGRRAEPRGAAGTWMQPRSPAPAPPSRSCSRTRYGRAGVHALPPQAGPAPSSLWSPVSPPRDPPLSLHHPLPRGCRLRTGAPAEESDSRCLPAASWRPGPLPRTPPTSRYLPGPRGRG